MDSAFRLDGSDDEANVKEDTAFVAKLRAASANAGSDGRVSESEGGAAVSKEVNYISDDGDMLSPSPAR